MGPSYEDYRARRHFSGLDGVRAVAILGVLEYHTVWARDAWWHRGFLGVDLFFGLSGYLIATLLLREWARTEAIDLKGFWVRRARRILPAFLVMMAIFTAYYAGGWGSDHAARFFADLPFNLLFLSNWWPSQAPNMTQLWSLAAEEQFYLVWPLVVALVPRWSGAVAAAFVGVGAVALAALAQTNPIFRVAEMYGGLALGVGLAQLLHWPAGYRMVQRLVGWPGGWAVTLVAIVAAFRFGPGDLYGLPQFGVRALFVLLIAQILLRPDSVLVRLLEVRAIRRIGAVSYGMYIYQYFAIRAAQAVLGRMGISGGVLLFLVTAALTYALAEVSFRWIERRFVRRRAGDAVVPA